MGRTLGSALVSGEVFQLGDKRHTSPCHPAPLRHSSASPGLGQPANEKREKKRKKILLCVKAKLGERGGEKEKKKKKDNMWVVCSGRLLTLFFWLFYFLAEKSSRGCSAEGPARSQEHPRPTQGPKFSWQRPPAPSAEGNRFKARRSQEKLKSETVRGSGRAGGSPQGCSEHPARCIPGTDAATGGWEIRG